MTSRRRPLTSRSEAGVCGIIHPNRNQTPVVKTKLTAIAALGAVLVSAARAQDVRPFPPAPPAAAAELSMQDSDDKNASHRRGCG